MVDRASGERFEDPEDSAAELERAPVALATLERENAELCGKLGTRAEARSRATAKLRIHDQPRVQAAYRTADLGLENPILTNRALGRAKPRRIDGAVAIAAFLLLEAVIGLATRSFPVMVLGALLSLGGWALLRLRDAMRPAPRGTVSARPSHLMTEPRAALSAVAEERTLSWALAKRRYLAAAAVVAFFVWPLFVLGPVELVAVTVYFAAMSILFLAPARLHIGTDGIMLRWLGKRRFIGYDEMVGLVNFEKNWATACRITPDGISRVQYDLRVVGLHVVLGSGEKIAAAVVLRGSGDAQLERIERQILESREVFQKSKAMVGIGLLRRGNRDLGTWVTALRALGAGANADARTAPTSRDQLLAVVEAPASLPTERVAAAIALGSDLDDEARVRLRSVSEGIAAPRLRIAIEKASGGADAAEMEAVLAEVENEEQKTSGQHASIEV